MVNGLGLSEANLQRQWEVAVADVSRRSKIN